MDVLIFISVTVLGPLNHGALSHMLFAKHEDQFGDAPKDVESNIYMDGLYASSLSLETTYQVYKEREIFYRMETSN